MTAATMPREWVRGPQWASEAARETWEPILRRAQAAWSELELASVTEHLRSSALVHLAPGELVQASRDCAGQGLAQTLLEAHPAGTCRAAVHWPGPLAAQWHRAWADRDDDAIGRLLGFPACCRAFFARTWGSGSCDPTPAMASLSGPWEANTLLRQLGVRLVPHLPCSASCEATVAQARAGLEVGRRAGLDVAALEALLRLPARYSALNGVAIVETPHFRFIAGADLEAACSLARSGSTEGTVSTFGAGALVALHGREAVVLQRLPASWEDNGFSTESAMRAAHAVVMERVRRSGFGGGWVWDLGAGDGSLLEAIRREWPSSRCCGVEADPGRVERGLQRHPQVHLYRGLVEEFEIEGGQRRPGLDLVLLMPGRLLEMPPAQAAALRMLLRAHARRLVLYSYDGELAALAARAGLQVEDVVQTQAAEAGAGRVA